MEFGAELSEALRSAQQIIKAYSDLPKDDVQSCAFDLE